MVVDTAGNFKYGKAFTFGGDDNNSIATDGYGSLYFGGDYWAPSCVIGPDTLNGTGYENGYLVKYGLPGKEGTGIQNIAAGSTMTLYPNPSKGQFTLAFDAENAGTMTLSLYDLSGRLITTTTTSAQTGSNTLEYDAVSLSQGVYIYEVNINGNIGRGKLVME
jgi:hypothetical protein